MDNVGRAVLPGPISIVAMTLPVLLTFDTVKHNGEAFELTS